MPLPEKSFAAGGCSSVVERALRMCEVPGSIPGISKQPMLLFLFYSRTLDIHTYLLLTYSRAPKNSLKVRRSSEKPPFRLL